MTLKKCVEKYPWQLVPFCDWKLTSGIKNYKATERIIILSRAVERKGFKKTLNLPIKVKKTALKFEATPRLTELAVAKVRKEAKEVSLPAKVSPGALSCEASPRVQELATPKKPVKKLKKTN